MKYRLTSKDEALSAITDYFVASEGKSSVIAIHEDKCFDSDKWLSLGEVKLNPGEVEPGEERRDRIEHAVSFGFFEWQCETTKSVLKQLEALMNLTKEEHKKKAARALDAVACVAARVGLIHPLFDADAIAQMPFRRPTTVVSDTSAVLQGGLDFVVRFLYPMARLKVPAIAHMEILNASDNYLKYRRGIKIDNKAKALFEHASSQGGQRALLRLELQTEAEIERGRLGADPLRGIVQPDSDQEDKVLGLQQIQRSFADRLIFETARQHLSQTNPGHPVVLLTADQGLARMTLGEGMETLYFEATTYGAISGASLSGTTFDPFNGKIYSVGLLDLLWEFAVTFGMARLSTPDGSAGLEVGAMGETLTWQPYHAQDDLLWVCGLGGDQTDDPAASVPPETVPAPATTARADAKKRPTEEKPPAKPRSFTGSYKFGVAKLFALIDRLNSKPLNDKEAMEVVGVSKIAALDDYKNFLTSGRLVEQKDGLVATESLTKLVQALKVRDLDAAVIFFVDVPSFAGFFKYLNGEINENPVAERAKATYVALGEVLGVCFEIPKEKVYPTLSHPTLNAFTEAAVASYERLAKRTDQYVLTGDWLEGLVRDHGIHPVRSRSLLEEARVAGLLERFTEGSTPETGFQEHTLNLLEMQQGRPTVRRIGLFEGDFLLAGKSSVSIRLKRVTA